MKKSLITIGSIILVFTIVILIVRNMVKKGKIDNAGLIRLFGTDEQKKNLSVSDVETKVEAPTTTDGMAIVDTGVITVPDESPKDPSIVSQNTTIKLTSNYTGDPVLDTLREEGNLSGILASV